MLLTNTIVIAPSVSIDRYDPEEIDFWIYEAGCGSVIVQEKLPETIERALLGMNDEELTALNGDFRRATQARNEGKKTFRTILCDLDERNRDRLSQLHGQSCKRVIGNVFGDGTRYPLHTDDCPKNVIFDHQHIWGPGMEVFSPKTATTVRVVCVREDFVIAAQDGNALLQNGDAYYLPIRPGTSVFFNARGAHRTSRLPGKKIRQLSTPAIFF